MDDFVVSYWKVDNKPFEGLIYHYLTVDILDEPPHPNKLLCVKMGENPVPTEIIGVTIEQESVTCKECLEWLHA